MLVLVESFFAYPCPNPVILFHLAHILYMKVLIPESKYCKNISISISDDEFMFEEKIQKRIDEIWNQKLIDANSVWEKIWDWNNYYLKSYTIDDEMLSLELGHIKFRNMSMLKFLSDEYQSIAQKITPHWLFVTSMIKTIDDHFIFAIRNPLQVVHNKKWTVTTIWWVLSRDETTIHTFQDISNHMLVEISEELWVSTSDVWRNECIWIVESRHENIGIVFYSELHLTLQQVQDTFSHNSDWEMSEIIWIPSSELYSFLVANRDHWTLSMYAELLVKNKIIME